MDRQKSSKDENQDNCQDDLIGFTEYYVDPYEIVYREIMGE